MKKVMLALIILISLAGRVFAEETAAILSDASGKSGDTVSITLSIPCDTAALGHVTIEYDNENLEFISHTFSDTFKSMSSAFSAKNAQIMFNWISPFGGVSLENCCEFVFRIIGEKSSVAHVDLSEVRLLDLDEVNIDVSLKSSSITIEGISPEETAPPAETISQGGGSMNSTPPVVPASETPAPYISAVERTSFFDLDGYSWASSAVNKLAESGIIKGLSDTEFAPGINIKRADYMILLIKMLGVSETFEDNFSDVAKDKYYYEYVGIAKKLGIATGVGDNRFNPEEYITRQDMFVLAYRILEKNGVVSPAEAISDLEGFDDYSDLSEYARQALSVLVDKGLVSGSENRLNPIYFATRAETAVFVYNIYSILSE